MSRGISLTPAEYTVWEFIYKYRIQFGYAPSYAEIRNATGLSTGKVCKRLTLLEAKGWLTRTRYKVRTMQAVYPFQKRGAA